MPPLEIGLDQVAGKQEHQNHKPDQIEIEQKEHKGVTGRRQKGVRFLATGSDDL
jgi:hypothetical protein